MSSAEDLPPERLAKLAISALKLLVELSKIRHNTNNESDYGRSYAMESLMAVSSFLNAATSFLPRDDEIELDAVSNPFLLLTVALKDLERGTVHPVLRPAAVQTRPQLPSAIRMGRGVAAAAMECLMLAGFTSETAARHVARRIVGSELLENVKREPWKAVTRWREDIQVETPMSLDQWRNDPTARPDVVVFHHYLSEARIRRDNGVWTTKDLETWANALLDDAAVNPFSRKGRAK